MFPVTAFNLPLWKNSKRPSFTSDWKKSIENNVKYTSVVKLAEQWTVSLYWVSISNNLLQKVAN